MKSIFIATFFGFIINDAAYAFCDSILENPKPFRYMLLITFTGLLIFFISAIVSTKRPK
jgi:hypothetical protein